MGRSQTVTLDEGRSWQPVVKDYLPTIITPTSGQSPQGNSGDFTLEYRSSRLLNPRRQACLFPSSRNHLGMMTCSTGTGKPRFNLSNGGPTPAIWRTISDSCTQWTEKSRLLKPNLKIYIEEDMELCFLEVSQSHDIP